MVITVPWLRWIVLFPALGVLLHLLAGRRWPRLVPWAGPGVVGLAFAVAVAAVVRLAGAGDEAALVDPIYRWIQVGALDVQAALRVDWLSAIMVLVVTGIGFLIHVYAVGYMHDDPDRTRFFVYLNLFVTAMLVLVLADNLLVLFVGWEGVGLCSYLLIGFWYRETANADAGKKAFLVNRIGDAGFLLGLFVLVKTLGTLEIAAIERQAATLAEATLGGWPVPLVVALLLFVGATGKSAQIPLYVWLPDAMAGPTPVSALIHAATMVTAGVYMIARLHAVYALAPAALGVVAFIGAATALLAALIALAQTDIKRVLAYSTVSQLGYMFLGLGVGVPGAAVFHLVTHAFFKGLLFLGAGSVIHGMGGEQDMRKMGGLRSHMPVTFATMLVATLAIAGVPPLSGFFSKDEILWGAFAGPHAQPVAGVIGYVVAALTAFYMGRLFILTFLGTCRADEHTRHHIHESPAVMTVPLVVLAVLSALGGFLPIPALAERVVGEHHGPHAPLGVLALAVALAVGGLAVAWRFYGTGGDLAERVARAAGPLYALVRDKFRIDELYAAVVVRPLYALADLGARVIDPAVIDGAADGAAALVRRAGERLRRMQSGNVQHYAALLLVGALGLLGYVLTR
ncbi:MAG TPA: NADH-quinone oxidoreductase subunit L [Candidatus Limnocylindria bacterium]|nr:NADH-quinone oxidoreductase subunit L [Candidatus Limnocylindria bacterium]